MKAREAKHILLADDSEFFRIKMSEVLREAGHRVELVDDGGEVISRLERNPLRYDLLLLDLQMPQIDGFRVLEWMKGQGLVSKVPVLVITGAYESSEVIDRVKGLGAAGYISKGVPPSHILYRVNKALYGEVDFGRRKTRVPTSIPVDFTCDGITRTGFILNLSETGAFVYSKELLRPGDRLALRFSLPGSQGIIEAEGRVVWVNELGRDATILNGMGIHFTRLSPKDRALIASFVESEKEKLV